MRNHEEAGRELEAILKDNPLRQPASHSTTYQGLLSDLWSGTPIERKLLLRTLFSGILDELLTESPQTLSAAAVESFAKKLTEREGISVEHSRWCILVWAQALHLGPAVPSPASGKPAPKIEGTKKKTTWVWWLVLLVGLILLTIQFPSSDGSSRVSAPPPPEPGPGPVDTTTTIVESVASLPPQGSLVLSSNEACSVSILQEGVALATIDLKPNATPDSMMLPGGAYQLIAINGSRQRIQNVVELTGNHTVLAFHFARNEPTPKPIRTYHVETDSAVKEPPPPAPEAFVLLKSDLSVLVVADGTEYRLQPNVPMRVKLSPGPHKLRAVSIEDRTLSSELHVFAATTPTETTSIRMVRTQPPPLQRKPYVQIGDLYWSRTDNPGSDITALEADRYAEGLVLGGLGDWRLPSPKELAFALQSGQLQESEILVRGSKTVWTSARSQGLARCISLTSGKVLEYPTFRSVGRALCVHSTTP